MSCRSWIATPRSVATAWSTVTKHNLPLRPSLKATSRTVSVRVTRSPTRRSASVSICPPAHIRRGSGTGGRKPPLAAWPSGPRESADGVSGARHQCRAGGAIPLATGARCGAKVAPNSAIRRGVTRSDASRVRPIQAAKSVMSVGARQAEHVLGQVGENQVRRDRRDLIEARLAELALDVVLLGEAEAAMGLDAGIGRLERGVGGEHLGHVGLRARVGAALVEGQR